MACFFEKWKSGLQRIRLFKIVMAKPNGVKKHDIYLPNTCGKATGIRREEQNGHFPPGNWVQEPKISGKPEISSLIPIN